MEKVSLTKPDDWHLHLRGGAAMRSVVGMSALQMGRAVIMPNLAPPIVNVAQAIAYRLEIMSSLPKETTFSPLMVLYLTDNTTKIEISEASKAHEVHAVKLYPAGATTNSESGVTNLSSTYPALEQMQKEGMPLLIHGEVTDHDIDIFDREKVHALTEHEAIVESYVNETEQIAVVKYDKDLIDEDEVRGMLS